jgi:hypothetical protein
LKFLKASKPHTSLPVLIIANIAIKDAIIPVVEASCAK